MKNRVLTAMAMATASAIIMILETIYFHILVYIKNYLEATSIISVALLGIAIGGFGGYQIHRRHLGSWLPSIAIATGLSIILSLVSLVVTPQYLEYPLLLLLPFTGASVIVSYLFTTNSAHKAYFWNLLGASVGVAMVCVLTSLIRSENVVLLSIALCGGLAVLLALSEAKNTRLAVISSSLITVLGVGALAYNMTAGLFDFGTSTHCANTPEDKYKTFCKVRKPKSHLVHVRDNLVARVDVFRTDGAPGYSVHQEGLPSDAVWHKPPSAYTWDLRIPKDLIVPDPKILVIGASAEGVTKTAKLLNDKKSKPVGIEINPGIVDLMKHELRKPSWQCYDKVDIHVMDARTYLAGTDKTFDIMTLMNAHTRGRVAENAGMPQYLFTSESFELMFRHLTNRGALVFEELRFAEDSDTFILKTFASAIDGLRKSGVKSGYEKHFYGFTFKNGEWRYILFMVKKQPWTETDTKRMDDWFAFVRDHKEKERVSRTMAMVLHPDRVLPNLFSQFVAAPEQKIRQAAAEQVDLREITDDHPFLYDLDVNHPEAWKLSLWTLATSFLLVLLPSFFLLRRSFGRGGAAPGWISIAYFSVLGIAFMLVELVLMQKYQLFLGSPVYSMIVVLGSILLFSGIGSLASSRFSDAAKRWCILAIPALLLAQSLGMEPLFNLTQHLPLAARAVVALLSLFPLFFLMGVPFPYGLSIVRNRYSAEDVALAYGINGAFGTIGVSLSVLISVHHGFAWSFYLGVGLYLLAFGLIHWAAVASHTAAAPTTTSSTTA